MQMVLPLGAISFHGSFSHSGVPPVRENSLEMSLRDPSPIDHFRVACLLAFSFEGQATRPNCKMVYSSLVCFANRVPLPQVVHLAATLLDQKK